MRKGVVWAVCVALAVFLCAGGQQGSARAESCKHSAAYINAVKDAQGESLSSSSPEKHTMRAQSAKVRYYCPLCGQWLSDDYIEKQNVTYDQPHIFDKECEICNRLNLSSVNFPRSFSCAGQGTCKICGWTYSHTGIEITMTSDKTVVPGTDVTFSVTVTNATPYTLTTFGSGGIGVRFFEGSGDTSDLQWLESSGKLSVEKLAPKESYSFTQKIHIPKAWNNNAQAVFTFYCGSYGKNAFVGHVIYDGDVAQEPEPEKPPEQDKEFSTWEEWFEFWKEKYPDRVKDANGKDVYHYWNHPASPQHADHVFSSITTEPCDKHPFVSTDTGNRHCNNSGKGSWQCQGFVDMLTKQATGEYCSDAKNGWKLTTYTDLDSLIKNISVGDVLEWNDPHWLMITSIDRAHGRIGVLECNIGGFPCIIYRGYRCLKNHNGNGFSCANTNTLQNYYGGLLETIESIMFGGTYASSLSRGGNGTGFMNVYHFSNNLNHTAVEEYAKKYSMLSASGTTHMKGTTSNAVLRCDGLLSKFIRLLIDGIEVNTKNYTLASGSTVVTFTEEYLNTLSVGEHDVTFIYDDGTAEAKLYITAPLPQTGDDTPLQFWTVMMLLAAAGLALLTRRRAEQR